MAHADVKEEDIAVIEAEWVDASEDGVIGEARALAVDGEIVSGLGIEFGNV